MMYWCDQTYKKDLESVEVPWGNPILVVTSDSLIDPAKMLTCNKNNNKAFL